MKNLIIENKIKSIIKRFLMEGAKGSADGSDFNQLVRDDITKANQLNAKFGGLPKYGSLTDAQQYFIEKLDKTEQGSREYNTILTNLYYSVVPWIIKLVNEFYRRNALTNRNLDKNELYHTCKCVAIEQLPKYDASKGAISTWLANQRIMRGVMSKSALEQGGVTVSTNVFDIMNKLKYIYNVWSKYYGNNGETFELSDAITLYRFLCGWNKYSDDLIAKAYVTLTRKEGALDNEIKDGEGTTYGDMLSGDVNDVDTGLSPEMEEKLEMLCKQQFSNSDIDPLYATALFIGYLSGFSDGGNLNNSKVIATARYYLSKYNLGADKTDKDILIDTKKITRILISKCPNIKQVIGEARRHIQTNLLVESIFKLLKQKLFS